MARYVNSEEFTQNFQNNESIEEIHTLPLPKQGNITFGCLYIGGDDIQKNHNYRIAVTISTLEHIKENRVRDWENDDDYKLETIKQLHNKTMTLIQEYKKQEINFNPISKHKLFQDNYNDSQDGITNQYLPRNIQEMINNMLKDNDEKKDQETLFLSRIVLEDTMILSNSLQGTAKDQLKILENLSTFNMFDQKPYTTINRDTLKGWYTYIVSSNVSSDKNQKERVYTRSFCI